MSLAAIVHALGRFGDCLPGRSGEVLPEMLVISRFHSRTSVRSGVDFVYTSNRAKRLVSILPAHGLPQLADCFLNYTGPRRMGFLIASVGTTCFRLAGHVLPGTGMIVSQFRVVGRVGRTFGRLHVHRVGRLHGMKRGDRTRGLGGG